MNGNCGPLVVEPGHKVALSVAGPAHDDITVKCNALTANVLAIESLGDSLQDVISSLSEVDKVAFEKVYTQWRNRYDDALPSHLNDDFGIYCISKATIGCMDKYIDSISAPQTGSFMEPVYRQAKSIVARYREQNVAKERIRVGEEAPNFTLPDMDGNLVSLFSYRGKWVLLDFWGSWCKWCMAGVPQMKENYTKYSDKCEFIGIDCNDSKADWIRCVKNNAMDWVQLYNEPETGQPASILYGVSGYPTKILINPEGRIATICVGEDKTFYDNFSELMN